MGLAVEGPNEILWEEGLGLCLVPPWHSACTPRCSPDDGFGCVVGFWATSQLVGGRALWFPVLASQAHGWLQILASPLSGQVTLGKSLHISRLCVFCKMEVLPFQLLWVAEGFHESLQVPEDLRTRPCLASLSGRAQGSQEFWVNVHKAKCPFSRSAEPL